MADSRKFAVTARSKVVFAIAVSTSLLFFTIAIGCARPGEAAEASTRATTSNRGHAPVVIELFTSEGCSSCPPADDLVADLIGEANSHQEPVYALAFHVDYWDRLGWRDSFSSADYSSRQRRYAAALGTGQVYTPQLVVNGRIGFDGSDAREARKQIRTAAEQPSAAQLVMTPRKPTGGKLTIDYAVRGAPKLSVLNAALVERSVATSVERGENAGRTLRHANVVRAFGTASLADQNTGKIELKLPESLDPKNTSLIGFIQDDKSMAVLGAAAADLPS
jgi:hypothetical protein